MSENRALRKIFGPKRDEVKGGGENCIMRSLMIFHCSHFVVRVMKSRRMGWAEHVAPRMERRGVCRVLVGKPEGKCPLGRSRRRWEHNI